MFQEVDEKRLSYIFKDKERVQEASQRIQEMNASFARDAEKKLAEKMEVSQENKTIQIKQLQERLKEHVRK